MKFKAWIENKNINEINKMFHDPEEFQAHQRSTPDTAYGSYEPAHRDRYVRDAQTHKGNEATRLKLGQMYAEKWHKAINDIHEFLELRAAYDGNDVFIKIFDNFIDQLHRAGMMG